ncbi:hypothetical protein, partial [Anaerosporobacter sp.]
TGSKCSKVCLLRSREKGGQIVKQVQAEGERWLMKKVNIIAISLIGFIILIIGLRQFSDKDTPVLIDKGKIVLDEGKDFTEKTENIELSNDTNYEIYYEEFSVKDNSTHMDIHIEYPQIKNMKSSEIETKVNNLLMEKAISAYGDEESEGLSLPMETKVEYFTSNIISVKYTGYGFYYGSMHGNNIMYATNINLKTGEIIDINYLFTDCFQEKLNRNIFMYNGSDKASEGEEVDPDSFEFGYANADEGIIIEMFKNYFNNMEVDKYYFSDKYFNIIAETPSGPTTYLELAASYDDLRSCMNPTSGFWSDIVKLK